MVRPVEYDGTFISLEGLDGSGKSTVCEAIKEEYPDAVFTSEPSDYWTGDAVYRAIRGEEGDNPALTNFFLYMADRTKHIEDRILPALKDGKMVVSDRYADSTRAYQSFLMEDEVVNPEHYIELVMDSWNLEPDLTVYLDVSLDTSMDRLSGEDDYEKRETLEHVKANYEEVIEGKPPWHLHAAERWERVDAEQDKEAVLTECLQVIEEER